jgi:hypothetical protein
MSSNVTVPKPSLVVEREPLAPWYAATLLAIGVFVLGVVTGSTESNRDRFLLTVIAASVLTATRLVAHRSRKAAEVAAHAQLSRPATEELASWASRDDLAVPFAQNDLPPNAAGMLEYSAAVVELLEHAVEVALREGMDPTELATGRDDAAALHDLLTTMAAEPVHLRKAAKVHTICAIWESSQPPLEEAAAALDAEFYRRWKSRNLAALRLRHGQPPARSDTSLPYRDMTPA